MEDITIESLIAQGRVVTTTDLNNPAEDYFIVGVYQQGTNSYRGVGTSYKNYAMSLADIIGGGSVYTGSNGIALVGNDFQFASQNISQFTNDLGYITSAGPIATTAGNTLLTCITDIFVQNVNSCSPLNINASNGQDVLIVAGGGNVGIGTATPADKLVIQVAATDNYVASFTDGTIKLSTYVGTGAGGTAGQIGMESAHDLLIYGYKGGVYDTFIKYQESAVNKYWGVNTYFPTAAWDITGQSSTSSDYALKVHNSASSALLYVRNDGNVGVGIATPLAKLHVVGLVGGTTILGPVLDNLAGWSHLATVSGGNGFLFLENGGSSNVVSSHRVQITGGDGGHVNVYNLTGIRKIELNGAAGSNHLVVNNDAHTGGLEVQAAGDVIAYQKLGVGTATLDPNARMTINGDLNLGSNLISTASLYNLISTKQNQHGIVSYRSGSDDIYAGLGITDGGIWYFRANKNGRTLINTTADAGGGPGTESLYVASTTGDAAIWINSVGGPNVYPTLIFGNAGTQYSYIQGTGSNLILGTNTNFQVRNRLTNATKLFIEPLGNTLFTYDPTGTETPTARLETRGEDDGSVFFAFKAKNKTGATKLSIRNDGQVNISSLQSSGTGSPPGGLVSGDLWLDTSGGGNPLVSIVP